MIKKIVLSFIVFCVLTGELSAQKNDGYSYKTAVGVKYYPEAISLKHFIANDKCIEALAYFWRGNRLTGLYEKNYTMTDFESLKWYVGAGAHVSLYDKNYNDGVSYVGLDGVLGLDYKPSGIPLNFSLDWQPSFDIGGGNGFSANWSGLAVRYILE